MEIGALWLKKTNDGRNYMSGKIEFPGFMEHFAVFKNEDKQNDSQPDYRIVWNPPKQEQSNGMGTRKPLPSNFNDGIPF